MRHRRRVRGYAAMTVAGVLLATGTAGPVRAQGADTEEIERSRDTEAEHAESIGTLRVELAEVGARLDGLYADADAAILAYGEQLELLRAASRTYEEARAESDAAAERHERSREDSVEYAVAAYQGSDLGAVNAWVGGDGPQEVVDRGGYLRLLAGQRQDQLDRTDAARVVGETMRKRARTAQDERGEAAESAADAKEAALEAVSEQESELESVLEEQTELETALAAAQDNTAELEAERERALKRAQEATANDTPAEQAPPEEAPAEDASPGEAPAPPAQEASDTAECAGGSLEGYANGQIPRSALCPLPQPGEMLRADAAAAFIELDGAYRGHFGVPMCVTDSYRPFDEQVLLFRDKPPGMAAQPGSSAHGLGVAVDLCGGVNVHDSAQYAWMTRTAPSHGWVNPPWAQGGFEPWHWEYQG